MVSLQLYMMTNEVGRSDTEAKRKEGGKPEAERGNQLPVGR
jgi:hypothetical protein